MPSSAARPARLLVAAVASATLLGGAVAAAPATTAAATGPVTFQFADAVRTSARFQIVAAAKTDAVTVRRTIVITGSALTKPSNGSRKPRRVMLVERKHGIWRQASEIHETTRTGSFTIKVGAGRVVKTRAFRVRVAASNHLAAAITKSFRVQVVRPAVPTDPSTDPVDPTDPPQTMPTPDQYDAAEALPAGYVGAGSATAWTYMRTGGNRWNPCRVIRWAYNPEGEGYPALADVQRAFAKISGVSGLPFKFVGTSTEHYRAGEAYLPARSGFDILIDWANEQQVSQLADGVVGIGGGVYYPSDEPDADVTWVQTRGYLVLDNGEILPGGFDSSPAWGPVYLHEIGHAVGLGHSDDQVQVMFPMLYSGNGGFGAGDLAGLQKVGAGSGCLR